MLDYKVFCSMLSCWDITLNNLHLFSNAKRKEESNEPETVHK